jgi:hypothetical protein
MSYASTAALQTAVYGALAADATVASLTEGAIYDAMPPGAVPDVYVRLGPEVVRDASDKTGSGARHDFPVTVVTETSGYHVGKEIAAAISDALVDADLTLERGALVALNFLRARARRVQDKREIEVWFRALIDTSGA